ncbi:MAG: preprotein translocase subunit SecG [Lachnospirales bacterium]
MFTALSVVIVILSLVLIGLILAQKKQAAGFTNAIGGMASGGASYWDKNKKNSIEGKLELYTKVVAVVDAICILVVNLI